MTPRKNGQFDRPVGGKGTGRRQGSGPVGGYPPAKAIVSGIKVSPPLLALRLRADRVTTPGPVALLCRILRDAKVNIAYLTSSVQKNEWHSLCCMEWAQRDTVAAVLNQNKILENIVIFQGPVVLLTLYPHGFSLKMLNLALKALIDNGIRLHGLASSISALTFVIDQDCLSELGRILSAPFDLPGHALPFQSDIHIPA